MVVLSDIKLMIMLIFAGTSSPLRLYRMTFYLFVVNVTMFNVYCMLICVAAL